MKKSLFTIATLAVATTAFAQVWQKPEYNGVYQPLTAGDTVYVFNVESKQFLTEGNDWGTHASVGDTGLKCVVGKALSESGTSSEQPDLAEWDGKTYTIQDYSLAKKGWKYMFITDGGNLYVDQGTQADIYFSFKDLGNNTYNIYGADANPVWNTLNDNASYLVGHYDLYFNARDGEETGTGIVFGDTGTDSEFEPGTFHTTWAFVSQDDYAVYMSKVAAYQTAGQLKDLIDEAKQMGIDTSEAEAAYANTAASAEFLQDAIEALNAKILAYYEESVTPDNPRDLTSMIKNPTCDDTSGWSNSIGATTWENANMSAGWQTGWEEGAFTDSYLNIWGATLSGSVCQEIGNLPKGIYVFNISALAEKDGANVYANMNYKAIPADSKGRRYSITTNVTDGHLEFGIAQTTDGTNWLCMDNASLFYYGSGLDAYKHWLSSLKETTPDMSTAYVQKALVEEYNDIVNRVDAADTEEAILAIVKEYEDIINRINLNVEAYGNLYSQISAAEEMQDNANTYYAELIGDYCMTVARPAVDQYLLGTDEVNAIAAELQAMMDEAQQYVWNMEKLASEVTKAIAIYEEHSTTCSPEAEAEYVDFIDKYDMLDSSSLTNADVLAMLDKLYAIEFNLQVSTDPASDENPIDYTAKIYNPSFSVGADGWTNEGWSTFGNNSSDWAPATNEEGAISADRLYLNLWNAGAANAFQSIAQLPAGAYTLTFGAYADAEGLQVGVNGQTASIPAGQDELGQYMRIYAIDFIVTDDAPCAALINIANTSDGALWAMVDEMHLYYKGTESEIITGIAATTEGTTAAAIYTLSGTQHTALQKGVNIVRLTDGTVRKVVVKP